MTAENSRAISPGVVAEKLTTTTTNPEDRRSLYLEPVMRAAVRLESGAIPVAPGDH